MGTCYQRLGLILWLLLAVPVLVAPASAAECATDAVYLRGDWGEVRFSVELADDDESRAQGLMHRESLPRSAGMLFVYPHAQQVGFWMKNTLIPLDMIFLDDTGTVTFIHEDAQPHDERPVIGPRDTRAVLEVNGGVSAQIGIDLGSEMRHPAFPDETAAWPC